MTSPSLRKIDGVCHCGRIAWEAEADPEIVYFCHCTDCQAISGGTGRWAVQIDPARFRLLKGTLAEYVKTADSGRLSHQMFCADCSAPIYGTSDGMEPRRFNLRLGTCRQRAEFVPTRELFLASAQPWARVGAPHD